MAPKRNIETPGAASVQAGSTQPAPHDWEPDDSDTPQVAALKAQLKAAHDQLDSSAKLPAVVFEPVTPKGAEAIAASAYYDEGITSKQLMAMIDAGEAKEPMTAVLCKDGYYAPRR